MFSEVIIKILLLALIIGPAVMLMLATVEEFKEVATLYRTGALHIPPPTEQVKEWPVIGSKAYEYWHQASTNLTSLIADNREEVKGVLVKVMDLLASAGKGIVLFALSIIICGVMLAYSNWLGDFAHKLLVKLAGKTGETMTQSIELTVRHVAKGIFPCQVYGF